MCCSKFILFTTNAILFLAGVFVIGIASMVISRGSEYGELLMDGVLTLPILILVIGIFISILGFLGCFGALRESRCMLYTYASIVMVFFLAEIVVTVFILVHPGATKQAFENYMDKQFQKYGGDDTALTNSIDRMQNNLECCGVTSTKQWYVWNNGIVPSSCCIEDGCNGQILGDNFLLGRDKYYKQGCLDAIIEDLKGLTLALGITAAVLGVLMFFSMATACGLARKHE